MIKTLVSANPGGLANRLKCLISLWRISDNYNLDLYVKWKRNDDCGAEFNKLFENNFNFIVDKEIKNKTISQTWRLIPFKKEIPDCFANAYPTSRGNNIDFEFHRIPWNVRENFLEYFNKLKPINIIAKIVRKFSYKYNLKDVVGVHIRRRHRLSKKENIDPISSDEKFIEKMNEILKEDPSTKFLLCTDCKKTENKFKELFAEKIIFYPKKSLDKTTILGTQYGLIDLLLLSKTKHILGSYRSTFNELAWWFGGCKAKVDIIIDEDLKGKIEAKIAKFKKSKYQKFKKVVYKTLCKLRIFKK